MTVFHARNLWKLAQACLYHAHRTRGIHQELTYLVHFKAHGELWNPLSNTVPSKFSFIVRRTCNMLTFYSTYTIFLNTWMTGTQQTFPRRKQGDTSIPSIRWLMSCPVDSKSLDTESV